MSMSIGYAYSPKLISTADLLPANEGRASRVHSLIEAFGLLESGKIEIIEPLSATPREIAKYHRRDFVDYLLKAENQELESDESDSNSESGGGEDDKTEYGLQYDCPVFKGLTDYVLELAGATLACADFLIENEVDSDDNEVPHPVVAINWTGGRHHARRANAAGFCYINDIALAILRLRTKYDKVMYIDLDLHHGDGVEAAFATSAKVLCISVHRYEAGFYPGTGSPKYQGKAQGDGYTVNIGTKRGLRDQELVDIYDTQIEPHYRSFQPDAVVMCIGCDGLARDPHQEWNLSNKSLDSVARSVVSWCKPTLLLGGGGYNHTESAKCWAWITAGVCGLTADRHKWESIPDHKYYDDYANDAFQF